MNQIQCRHYLDSGTKYLLSFSFSLAHTHSYIHRKACMKQLTNLGENGYLIILSNYNFIYYNDGVITFNKLFLYCIYNSCAPCFETGLISLTQELLQSLSGQDYSGCEELVQLGTSLQSLLYVALSNSTRLLSLF